MFAEMTLIELEEWFDELATFPFLFDDERADYRAVASELDHRYGLRVATERAAAVLIH